MKNPPDIDRMLAVLLTKKQRRAISHLTMCGYSKIAALRQIVSAGIESQERDWKAISESVRNVMERLEP